jgi:hypothetical protein
MNRLRTALVTYQALHHYSYCQCSFHGETNCKLQSKVSKQGKTREHQGNNICPSKVILRSRGKVKYENMFVPFKINELPTLFSHIPPLWAGV